eukprot:CAMPEP_0204529554 /NCGR_PEP_ID=MMETSP0661-20131031/10124_1 /ASSEMBLY_ACC=CAM_ASM_000606 /TAXON_ID=109239 /ORGANISM="Alexandrium margalefi, Strain AMGDE01CS-322" /LENGTH=181 /DNA_ID=CAMNT_0051535585 /DNA_START=55 /DNA_END=600 /DNA_ORIENTATION=-
MVLCRTILFLVCVGKASALSMELGSAQIGDVSKTALEAKMAADQREALARQVDKLAERVQAGGRMAKRALARLIPLTMEPNAKPIMKGSGLLLHCSKLMKSPNSSPEIQRLAGSLITLVTDLPVTSQISEDKTGSYGRVNVVLPRPSRVQAPDRTLLELDAGVAPSDTEEGDFFRRPSTDV